jgi:hypothetical protein
VYKPTHLDQPNRYNIHPYTQSGPIVTPWGYCFVLHVNLHKNVRVCEISNVVVTFPPIFVLLT